MYDANNIDLFKVVNQTVHPNDEMFKSAKLSMPEIGRAFHYYFYSGGLLATRVKAYLEQHGEIPASLSLLDFACGYCRVTRYFIKIFNNVEVSDLELSMLEFARNELGAHGFLSNIELQKVQFPDRRYDVVFCFSLFTHLSPEIWDDWFHAVYDRVRPGGFFIFSTRGIELARKTGENFGESSLVNFTEQNETEGRLDKRIYGRTTLCPSLIEEKLKKIPCAKYVDYFSIGQFDLYHDIHVVKRMF